MDTLDRTRMRTNFNWREQLTRNSEFWSLRIPLQGSARVGQNYVTPGEIDPRPMMASMGAELSQFGRQAPALRPVFVVAMPRKRLMAEEYEDFFGLTYKDVTLVSASAAETMLLQAAVRNGLVQVASPRPHLSPAADRVTRHVFDRVVSGKRSVLLPGGRNDFRNVEAPKPPKEVSLFVPFDPRSGLLSQRAKQQRLPTWNGGYFVWLEEEFDEPFSSAGDPIGLNAVAGLIDSPPIYQRTALVISHDPMEQSERAEASLQLLSLRNLGLELPCNIRVSGDLASRYSEPPFVAELNPDERQRTRTAFFNRLNGYRRHGSTASHTPSAAEDECLEFLIVRDEIVGFHRGGNSPIPLNGFVVRLPNESTVEQLVQHLLAGGHANVSYSLPHLGSRVLAAAQIGPRLLSEGSRRDVRLDLEELLEEYVPGDDGPFERGIPPIALTSYRQLDDRRARIGVGITESGDIVITAAEGCEPRSFIPEEDCLGVTTEELVRELERLGCVDAAALDSGGAAALYVDGTGLLRPADRNDVPGVPAERIVPLAWSADY